MDKVTLVAQVLQELASEGSICFTLANIETHDSPDEQVSEPMMECYADGKKVGEFLFSRDPMEINVLDRRRFGGHAYAIQDRFADRLIQERENNSLTRYN